MSQSPIPEDVTPWEPLPDENPPVPRSTRICIATGPNGFQCSRRSIPGGNVCGHHGGEAPQVKKAAQLRLAELVAPALGTLAREMVHAEKSADRLRAADSLLDRAGVPRQANIDVPDAYEILKHRLRTIRAEAIENDPPALGEFPHVEDQ